MGTLEQVPFHNFTHEDHVQENISFFRLTKLGIKIMIKQKNNFS